MRREISHFIESFPEGRSREVIREYYRNNSEFDWFDVLVFRHIVSRARKTTKAVYKRVLLFISYLLRIMKEHKTTYKTRDMVLAVFLAAHGFSIFCEKRLGKDHIIFVLRHESSDYRARLVREYYDGDALVNPNTYHTYYRKIATLMNDTNNHFQPGVD